MKFLLAASSVAIASALTSASDRDAIRTEEVNKINAMEGVRWTAGIAERFRGQPLGTSKSLLGVPFDQMLRTQTEIDAGNIVEVDAPVGFEIPESFDSEEHFSDCAKVIGDIRDQSNCGCCWAFGGASAASDRLCISTKGAAQMPVSAEDVCFGASNNGCGGGYLNEAWSFVKKGAVTGGNQDATGPLGGGFCAPFALPHCHHHGPQGSDPYPAEGEPGCPSERSNPRPKACASTAQAPYNDYNNGKVYFDGKIESYTNEAAIANAIMTGGPVETAFTVYDDFENYAGGVYSQTSKKSLGGHAVRIVGWGVDAGAKYWKVANSWNPYWGEEGYFRIQRGTNECGIESQAMAASADATWFYPQSQ